MDSMIYAKRQKEVFPFAMMTANRKLALLGQNDFELLSLPHA